MWGRTGISMTVGISALVLLGLAPVSMNAAPGNAAPGEASVQTGRYPSEPAMIEIAFDRDAVVRLRGGLPVDLGEKRALPGVDLILAQAGSAKWSRICQTSEEVVDRMTAQGEANCGHRLHNPNNMYRLEIGPGRDVWEISRKLERLPGVISARPVPLPMPVPTPGNYESQQGYLRPASSTPVGIDADCGSLWSGRGSGVSVCDLEYSWNYLHSDLTPFAQVHLYTQDPGSDDNHGTAVLGVLGSHDNGWGTKGICPDATLLACGTYFATSAGGVYSWNVPGAIVDAASHSLMNPGGVLLIEHQWNLPGYGFVPIEWWTGTTPTQTWNTVFSNIQWATATKRLHVIEPAGNGNVNLDGLIWAGDSGAIIAGAGGAYSGGTYVEGDLQRLSFSSYGARVDLQGWGENVVTTGFGDLYNADGKDYWYTSAFDGTSSASPVVAGAVACAASCFKANISTRFPMDYKYIRNVLKATGTPQVTPPAGNVGPRPNLAAAFPKLYDWRDATLAPLDTGNHPPAWGDYDGDGDLDLYLPNDYPYANRLLANNGSGVFTDVTPDLLKLSSYYSYSAVWGDVDNDGDLDLYVQNYGTGQNKLFRNGGGTWTDATSGPLSGYSAGVAPTPTWVDYNNDGRIDLYLQNATGANRLLRNNGDGSFTDVTSGPEGDTGNTTDAAWCDYDGDGDQDVYLVNSGTSNRLLRNDGGSFVDVTVPPLDVSEGGYACWGDYDNDGDFDLYLVIPNYGYANKLFRNDGGTFVNVASGGINGLLHDGRAGWFDADNDGDLDLYLVNNNERNCLFRNSGSGVFNEDTHSLLVWEGYTTDFSWGDCDNDGDLDPYFTVASPANSNTLVRNGSTGANHWLQVRLEGTSSNRCGIGARVRVVTSQGAQVREVRASWCEHTLITSFGLGTATTVDSLQVFWPGHPRQDSLSVAADQRVVISEVPDPAAAPQPGPKPLVTRLHPCAPNPVIAGKDLTLQYDLAAGCAVRLAIFDLRGRSVRRLLELPNRSPGSYPATWDGRDDQGRPLASGVYFCRLEAGSCSRSQPVTLLR